MNRPYRKLLVTTLALSSAIVGCTLIAETDRSKIEEETPASTGGMGQGGDNDGGDGDGGDGDGTDPAGGAGGDTSSDPVNSDPGGAAGSSN